MPSLEKTTSPVRPLLHADSGGANAHLATQDANKLPISALRVGTPRVIGVSMPAVRPPLTAVNLSQHMHGRFHGLSKGPCEPSDQGSSGGLDSLDMEAFLDKTSKFVHRTMEERRACGCDCDDDCRSSDCYCASVGNLCFKNCSCRVNERQWGCFNHLRVFNDHAIPEFYFGHGIRISLHSCFASRVLPLVSGELSVASIQKGSDRPRFSLISSTEMRLIEKLSASHLEGQFVEWVRQSKSISKLDHLRWLFRLALGEGDGVQGVWKLSFCEQRWLPNRVWAHCTICRRCHEMNLHD